MQYLSDQGFIPMLETIRRDVAPAWKAYFKFNESFSRFVEYIAARYGAYNFIFSKIHFDIYLKNYTITGAEFNEALNYHYKKYGPMPFGQPVTALIDHSTADTFGHTDKAPWITLHATGNKPRDHGIYAAIEALFRLSPPYPAIDLEPYYTGWMHQNNVVAGERPIPTPTVTTISRALKCTVASYPAGSPATCTEPRRTTSLSIPSPPARGHTSGRPSATDPRLT